MNIPIKLLPDKSSPLFVPGLKFGTMAWPAPISALLTTEHAASSYGQPVIDLDGTAYGAGDIDCTIVNGHASLPDAGMHSDWLPGEREAVLDFCRTPGSKCRV